MKKRLFIITLILSLLASTFLVACNPSAIKSSSTPTTTIAPPPTATPIPVRIGAYLDNIFMYETSPKTASQQILDGTLDIYASGLSKSQISSLEDSTIKHTEAINKQYELLVNPVDTLKTAKKLNPFSSSDVREALNYLIDRNYIVEDIFLNGANKKYVPLPYGLSDYLKYEDTIKQVEEKYSYDYEKANEIISNYLLEKECIKNEDGTWTYKDEVITLIVLIRNDDEMRVQIGDYICDQLESLGFVVDRQYRNQNQSSSIWAAGDPYQGLWHLYTGRWSYDNNQDKDELFELHYSPQSRYNDIGLYESYVTESSFYEAASALSTHSYETFEQRDSLFKELISTCNDYSFRIWLVDEYIYSPYSPELQLSFRPSSKMNTDMQTVFTLKGEDAWGGEINWGANSLLRDAVNPVGGSKAPSEKQFTNFTELSAIVRNLDPKTMSPMFIETAEVTFDASLTYTQDSTWIKTSSTTEIAVPNDALISWSEEKDKAIYADAEYMHDAVGLATAWLATYEREKPKDRQKIKAQQQIIEDLKVIENRGYITANVKVTVKYTNNIFELKWHDGSAFSIADIVMSFITRTQLTDKKSALYDPYISQETGEEIANFRGFKVISAKPLVIEYYTDSYTTFVSDNINPLWIDYTNGQQSWAMAAVANTINALKAANYTYGSSLDNESLYLDYLKGSSLDLLEQATTNLEEQSFIPYFTILAHYITPEIANSQYNNILEFYNQYRHFHIGIGPYMITNVDALTPTLTLSRFNGLTVPSDLLAELILSQK